LSAHPACATVVLYCEAHEPIDQDTSKHVCLFLTTMCGPVMDSDSDTSEGDYHSDDEVSFYNDQVKPFHSAGGTIKLTFAFPVGLCLGSARVLGPLAGGESDLHSFSNPLSRRDDCSDALCRNATESRTRASSRSSTVCGETGNGRMATTAAECPGLQRQARPTFT